MYTSGQIGAVKGKAEPDIKAQVRQALENLEGVLAEAGASLAEVIKTTVFLTDMKDYASMNEVYAEVFEAAGCAPARTGLAADSISANARSNVGRFISREAKRGKVRSVRCE